MIRIVIDTNILVSALLQPEGLPASVLMLALSGKVQFCVWVKPGVRVEECSDPDDNVFLERAQAGEADYLVTGNKRHFPDGWKKTKVIGARELFGFLMVQEK